MTAIRIGALDDFLAKISDLTINSGLAKLPPPNRTTALELGQPW
jgi:hypothetical protein